MFQHKFLTNIFALFVGLLSVLVTAKFPDDPKPCKYGDSDCIVKAINYFSQVKYEGDSSINLPKLDPLSISEISIKQGVESPVNIDLKFESNDLIGLRNLEATKVKGFGEDLKGPHEIHVNFKELSLVGDYSIKGRVLVLPISGNGKSNMTLVDTGAIFTFSGSSVERNGGKYMEIDNLQLTLKPKQLFYNFGNLFNGDKELGDNMNLFLNENWSDIFNEVKGSVGKAFGKVFETVINKVFEKYPYDMFFLK